MVYKALLLVLLLLLPYAASSAETPVTDWLRSPDGHSLDDIDSDYGVEDNLDDKLSGATDDSDPDNSDKTLDLSGDSDSNSSSSNKSPGTPVSPNDSDGGSGDTHDTLSAYNVDTNTRIGALQRLWKSPLAVVSPTAESLFQKAWKYEVPGRNWKRLAQKITTPGSVIKIVAFGGSLTAGHYPTCDTSWVEELVRWLDRAFPNVRFQLINLAHGATTASIAALCYYQEMPRDADLVLVEYSVNGCTVLQCMRPSQPQVAGYEHLLRQIIRKAPRAAIMSLAAFAFELPGNAGITPYYATGEDQHAVIAKRYGVPMVSVRDALYDIIHDDRTARSVIGMTLRDMLKDHVHPKARGTHLYGVGFVAWGIRHMITKQVYQPNAAQVLFGQQVSADLAASFNADLSEIGDVMAVTPTARFPRPVSPLVARELDIDGWCAADRGFEALPKYTSGWRFVDESRSSCNHPGCRKFGYLSDRPGSTLTVTLDTSRILSQPRLDKGDMIALVVLYHTSYYTPLGTALLTCESGCSCKPTKINGQKIDRSSELTTMRIEITPHPRCIVRIILLQETTSGGHKFRINGLALAPYTDKLPVRNPITDVLFNSTELLLSEGFRPCQSLPEMQEACAATQNFQ